MAARHKLVVSLFLVAALGVIAGSTTWSSFSQSTDNSSNSFASGTVTLEDNDLDGAVLSLSSARPGNNAVGCVKVTYKGSLPATVKMWATTTGSLAGYLDVKVRRGQTTAAFPSCVPFTLDGVDYIGAGDSVLYNGGLSSFPGAGSPLTDPTASSPETWTNNEAHYYEVTVTLPSGAAAAAQGLSSTLNLYWEATNQ